MEKEHPRKSSLVPPDQNFLRTPSPACSDKYSSGDEAELKVLSFSSPEISPGTSPIPSCTAKIVPKKTEKSLTVERKPTSISPEIEQTESTSQQVKPTIVVFSPEYSIFRDPEEEEEEKESSPKQSRPQSLSPSSQTIRMSSPRPKSPRVPNKKEESESFWDKIGTLGRKKKVKEVQEFQTEGQIAIDLPGSPFSMDVPPDDYMLEDNEERSMIQPHSLDDPKLKNLVQVLIDWVNDELAYHRIIVKQIDEDLYDGMVLHKLIEKLTGITLDVPEVTQSEEGQKQKLRVVLNAANHTLGLGRYGQQRWSVESIHSKNLIPIIHLLVALARHFRAPIRLPEHVVVSVVIVQKRDGQLNHRIVDEELTGSYDDLGLRCERDAFDTLFDHAPDKLQIVKKSLVTFVNKQLTKINLEAYDLENDFHDGVYLCLLMGLLEGYFVPLYHFHLTPKTFEEKLHNVTQAFELMLDAGMVKQKARPEDIVNKDLKSTLRVLYGLFTKYKNADMDVKI
ncbi:UNVERIFIED_CONTAM: hypothetical protein RMT77_010947 [Armadillidium vulgare]